MCPRSWQTLRNGRPISLRVVRLTIPLLVGLLLLVLAPPAIAAPALKAQLTAAPADVSVLIDTITPLSPGPKDTLRITGRVVDRSAGALTRVSIALHLG